MRVTTHLGGGGMCRGVSLLRAGVDGSPSPCWFVGRGVFRSDVVVVVVSFEGLGVIILVLDGTG